MAKIYEVQAKDISNLNAFELTKLLNVLLHSEARKWGIKRDTVDVTSNIYISDGGEDGRIEWTVGPDNTDFLPCRLVQFQNKATDMSASECSNELVGRDGRLKPMIKESLDRDGAYILFTTQECSNDGKKDRVRAIRERLRKLHHPAADKAIIMVYDANKICDWTNAFVPAIAAVLEWNGTPIPDGLCSWEKWEKYSEHHVLPYVPDESRAGAIKELRGKLERERECARITGASGLGKTRLAVPTIYSSVSVQVAMRTYS